MPQPMVIVVLILAFAAVVILIQTLSAVFFSTTDNSKRVNERLTLLASGVTREEAYSQLIRNSDTPKFLGVRLAETYRKFATVCQQAGLTVKPPRVLLIAGAAALVIWLFGLVLVAGKGGHLFSAALTSLAGAVLLSACGLWLWLSNRRAARLKLFAQQLPLALDVVTRAIRAGHPVISAVQLAAEELGDPVGSEFGLIVDETTYGAEFTEALANFAQRSGSPDAHFFAVAVSIQSETGGNLAEILENLVGVMRGRVTLGKKIKALASEGMASAYILSILPLAMLGFIMLTNPQIYLSKLSDPIFWPSVLVVMLLYLGGLSIIRRIMNFKY